jgi:hypothetical protein
MSLNYNLIHLIIILMIIRFSKCIIIGKSLQLFQIALNILKNLKVLDFSSKVKSSDRISDGESETVSSNQFSCVFLRSDLLRCIFRTRTWHNSGNHRRVQFLGCPVVCDKNRNGLGLDWE